MAPPRPMRVSASISTMHSSCKTDFNGLEVYVVMNFFKEWANGVFYRLPTPLRDGVRDSGICHYVTVFKQPDGSLVQFDYGPEGGDIYLAEGPLPMVFNRNKSTQRRREQIRGEVRERAISDLPDAHLFVGKTHLTMDEIRAWSDIKAQQRYQLLSNDCRHFVNALVRYSTGMDGAASSCLRNQWIKNKNKYGIAQGLVRFGQWWTDVANAGHVTLFGHTTLASLAAFSGHAILSKAAAKVAVTPIRRAIIHKPMVSAGTAAVATLASTPGSPVVAMQETGSNGGRLAIGFMRGLAGLAHHFDRASRNAANATGQVMNLASNVAGCAQKILEPTLRRPMQRAAVTPTIPHSSVKVLKNNKSAINRIALVAARR